MGRSAPEHLARDRIQRQVGELQLLHAPGRTAEQRAQAREQLLQREGLHQVVVGARVEAGNAVADRASGRQHQDRHGRALGAQLPRDLEAVDAGQHHVEHDRVGGGVRHGGEGLRAVLGEHELVPLGLERPHERVAHGRLVLDDQEAHRSSTACRRVLASDRSFRARNGSSQARFRAR